MPADGLRIRSLTLRMLLRYLGYLIMAATMLSMEMTSLQTVVVKTATGLSKPPAVFWW